MKFIHGGWIIVGLVIMFSKIPLFGLGLALYATVNLVEELLKGSKFDY